MDINGYIIQAQQNIDQAMGDNPLPDNKNLEFAKAFALIAIARILAKSLDDLDQPKAITRTIFEKVDVKKL